MIGCAKLILVWEPNAALTEVEARHSVHTSLLLDLILNISSILQITVEASPESEARTRADS